MKKFKLFLIALVITLYELLLVDYASGEVSLNIDWLGFDDSVVKKQQHDVEALITFGQVPVLFYFCWLYYRRQKAIEKDFLEKYGKNRKRQQNT